MLLITLLFLSALITLFKDLKKEKKYLFFFSMLTIITAVYILNLLAENDSNSRMIDETNKVIRRDSVINKMNDNVDSLVTKLKIQEEIITLLDNMIKETHSLSSKTNIIEKKQDTLTLRTNIISEEHNRINSFDIGLFLEVQIDSSGKIGKGKSNLLSGPLKIYLEDLKGNLYFFITYTNDYEYNSTNKKYYLKFSDGGKLIGQKIEKLSDITKLNIRFRDFLQDKNSRNGKFIFEIIINGLTIFQSPRLDIETERLNNTFESYIGVEKIFRNMENLYSFALNK